MIGVDALAALQPATMAEGGLQTAAGVLQTAEWANDGLIGEADLYRYTVAVMAVAAVGFLGWTTRLPDRRQRYGLVAAYLSIVACLSYFGMSIGLLRFESLGGQPVPATRFVGYLFSITVILLVTATVAGGGRKLFAALLVPFVAMLGGTFASWFLAEPLSLAGSLSSLLSFPLIAYVLLRPGARAAAKTTDERQLLYGKLRNLVLLAWGSYLVVGIISRQNLGLLDAFAGVFIGTYIDVVLHIGFAAILLRHGAAIDQLVGGASPGGDSPGGSDATPDGASAAD